MRSMATTKGAALRGMATIGLLGALVAAGGCGSEEPSTDGAAGVDNLPTQSETPSDPAESEIVSDTVSSFSDSFGDDRNGWALPPSEAGTTEIKDGDFVWESKQPQQAPHVLAATLATAYDGDRLDMVNVRVTASVTPVRGAAAMGLFCREVPDSDADFQWYEFVVRDGYAAIRQADLNQNLEVLVESDDVELPLGEEATIEATCVDGDNGDAQLTMMLNGDQVLETEVSDPLGNGAPGLQAYDSPADAGDEPMMIAWHDFTVEPAG